MADERMVIPAGYKSGRNKNLRRDAILRLNPHQLSSQLLISAAFLKHQNINPCRDPPSIFVVKGILSGCSEIMHGAQTGTKRIRGLLRGVHRGYKNLNNLRILKLFSRRTRGHL